MPGTVSILRTGAVGALATAFVLPSFALVLAVADLYVAFKGLTVIQALFYGIAPAVMAVLAVAAIKLPHQFSRQRYAGGGLEMRIGGGAARGAGTGSPRWRHKPAATVG